jgi:hypothetical protein
MELNLILVETILKAAGTEVVAVGIETHGYPFT